MAGSWSAELDGTVTENSGLVVPADAVARVVDVSPGDHVKVRLVVPARRRENAYGVLAARPIRLDLEDLEETRTEMWASFGTDDA